MDVDCIWAEEEIGISFPIASVDDIIKLFEFQLKREQPNLALLSLICGVVEKELTIPGLGSVSEEKFPAISENDIQILYLKYLEIVKCLRGLLLQDDKSSDSTIRGTIKIISNFIWSKVKKGFFKDKLHIQSMLGLVNGGSLDCFGIAYSVVALAQSLGFCKVHLSLSEDHSWVRFGSRLEETAEVTWYGRSNESKRGMPINHGINNISCNWLYLGNHEVKCNRQMEVAALVSSLNPGINSKCDSALLGFIQQKLLWMLFDQGIIKEYTMALCNLADLEEIDFTRDSPSIEALYEAAIDCSYKSYANHHVFPYTCYGGYLFRKGKYRQALTQWKEGARAASRYCHSGESEELYKDFAEIVDTFLPSICKAYKKLEAQDKDEFDKLTCQQTFLDFILLFDWLCVWEECSKASIVHNEWAKSFLNFLALFPTSKRSRIEFYHALSHVELSKQVTCLSTTNSVAHSEEGLQDSSKVLSPSLDPVQVQLHSRKIFEVSKHLKSERLDASTIRLQLTAPNSVTPGKRDRITGKGIEVDEKNVDETRLPKRNRRK